MRPERPVEVSDGNHRVRLDDRRRLAIVIAGRREDWAGGAKTLTPRENRTIPVGSRPNSPPMATKSDSGSPRRPLAG